MNECAVNLVTSFLHPHAAGIDVSASELFVAVSADRDSQPFRSFPTLTGDLNALADWLRQCGICARVSDPQLK